ncbi:MAG: DUF1552 domain-containing protein [Pseudomonadota bacterium]
MIRAKAAPGTRAGATGEARAPGEARRIPRRLSRRTLLRGAVGVGVGLPLMNAMMPASSRAQALAAPKRFGVFFSPCGTIPENWQCAGTESSFTLSKILEPLAPHQQDLVVIRGVNMESTQAKFGPIANVHDQGMTHMLTATGLIKGPAGAGRANHFLDGSAGGPSIDQHIAQAIGGTTLLPSLELGVETSSTFLEAMVTRMSYGNVDVNDTNPGGKRAIPIPAVDDPVQIYTRLFGTSSQGTAQEITLALQNRQSVLDYVSEDYADLMGRLGAEDRGKLDQYASSVRDIENRLTRLLTNAGQYACPDAAAIKPTQPARQKCLRDQDLRTVGELATQNPNFCVTNFREIGAMQMDLMILALSCDLTRVASLQWSTAESTVIHSWLPLQYAGTREHHMMTHNESVSASKMAAKVDEETAKVIRGDLTLVHQWYAQQFAYLVGKLKSIREGDRSLLDSMLLFWTNELGIGGSHSYTNIPYVLAGTCQGQLRTGRYLDFLGANMAGYGMGPAHNKLFVSFLQMFGINEDTFGIKDFSGPLPGLL